MKQIVKISCLLTLCVSLCGCLDFRRKKDQPVISPDQAYVDARSTLLHAATDKDPMTRSHAMEAIGRTLGSKEGGFLMEGLNDRAVLVRFSAAMALGDIAYPPAKDRLIEMVEDMKTDQRVVCAAIYALHRIGDDRYAWQLARILTSDYAQGRSCAAMVMGKMGERSAIGPLKAMLADETEEGVKLNIIEALALLGDPKSTRLLESFTQGYYLDLRLAAIPALAKVKPPRADAILRRLLGSRHPARVRVAAAGALGVMGQDVSDGYDLCVEAAQEPRKMLRDAYGSNYAIKPVEISSLQRLAAMSIGDMKLRKGIAVLKPLLTSTDGAVRVAAAMGILEILGPTRNEVKASTAKQEQSPAGSEKPLPRLHTSGGMN